MIKVGMIMAERYEIIEKIGTGGMSDVYRAMDHKLNRFVAVKVLKQEFAENADFVSKFRVEAQAAAGLMHPNIVNVYDVGEENGYHYIVMELVEGITLKTYIEKKARLSVKEAVSIAIQVSMGIESAHNNHIIHRDIKPQNIIISKEGKVKVTDFGIAKAATSNTITSNVMGSVHYTSPEQVRGGFSDAKSDIYSLGITLFEMLTGRVPFNGETTVAVAIKHIQEQMPSPRDYVPEVPISVEQIVLKCTQKSPDKRYQSVPELIEDLKRSLISPDENFVKMEENDNYGVTKNISDEDMAAIKRQSHKRETYDAQLSGTGRVAVEANLRTNEEVTGTLNNWQEEEWTEEPEVYEEDYYEEPEYEEAENVYTGRPARPGNKQPAKNNKNKKSGNKNGRKNHSSKAKTPAKQGNKPQQNRKNDKYEEEYDPKMEVLTTILVVVAAVIIGCIFIYVVLKALGFDFWAGDSAKSKNLRSEITDESTVSAEEVETVDNNDGTAAIVPNVVGLTAQEATVALEAEGFVVAKQPTNSDTAEKDEVISQDPIAETKLARGETITITYSIGAEIVKVKMPNLIGSTEEDALVVLAENGITVSGEDIITEYNDQYEEGVVFYQSFGAGFEIDVTNPVSFKVSAGPEPVYYSVNMSVNAPTDYAGGNVTVILKGKDGAELKRFDAAGFPVQVVASDIYAMPSGTYEVSYPAYVSVTDEAGNVSQTVSVKVTAPEAVTFTKNQ